MPLNNRITGLDASVFTLGGTDYYGDIQDLTITLTNKTENQKGAGDRWAYNAMVGSEWTLEGNLFALGTGVSTMGLGTASNPKVAVVFTHATGRQFTGTVTLSSVGLKYGRDATQGQPIKGDGWGTLTIPG